MNLINKFLFSIWNPFSGEKKYMGEQVIREEIERPVLEFFNKDSEKVIVSNFKFHNSISTKEREYEGILYHNNHYSELEFDEKELLLFKEVYELDLIEINGKKVLDATKQYYKEVETIEKPHIDFMLLIDNSGKEYLIISFLRYPVDYPERGKDQTAPFLTYIHGIWEAPILTEKIIEKIKA